jgi:hypothetical protein
VTAAVDGRAGVTTVRIGGAGTGRISATTAFASCLEVPKKRGRTSALFSGVMTFETSTIVERLSRPSRRGSMTFGYFWISSAAVFR